MAFDPVDYLPSVLAHRKALSELKECPSDTIEKVVKTAKEAAEKNHPLEHGRVQKIEREDIYRLRQGDYRALIDYKLGQVRILLVGHRKNVYSKDSLLKADHRSEQD